MCLVAGLPAPLLAQGSDSAWPSFWMTYCLLFLAILGFQVVFTLALGLMTRQRSFFWYAGFLAGMLVYTYARFGPVHQGYLGAGDWLVTYAPIFPFLSYYCYFRFIRDFLGLREMAPPLDRLARYLEIGTLVYVPLFFLFMNQPALRHACYLLLGGGLALGTIVLQVRLIPYRGILLRLIQWGSLCYFLGMMSGYLGRVRVLLGQELGPIQIDYMSIGLLAELFCFSLALAYKLRQEAEAKQEAQARTLAQLREIQALNQTLTQVRDRIARDLHDDIGSTLGTISLLGALAGQQLPDGHPAGGLVQRMGAYAREMGSAMNDAVWALDSRHDRPGALLKRMEDFAASLLGETGLAWTLTVDPAWHRHALDMDRRKNLYLIFKEGLYNVVRHAGATSLAIELGQDHDHLWLRLTDNGRGLPTPHPLTGNGLRNMQQRAAAAGMSLRFSAPPGGGTCLEVSIPRLGEVLFPPPG